MEVWTGSSYGNETPVAGRRYVASRLGGVLAEGLNRCRGLATALGTSCGWQQDLGRGTAIGRVEAWRSEEKGAGDRVEYRGRRRRGAALGTSSLQLQNPGQRTTIRRVKGEWGLSKAWRRVQEAGSDAGSTRRRGEALRMASLWLQNPGRRTTIRRVKGDQGLFDEWRRQWGVESSTISSRRREEVLGTSSGRWQDPGRGTSIRCVRGK